MTAKLNKSMLLIMRAMEKQFNSIKEMLRATALPYGTLTNTIYQLKLLGYVTASPHRGTKTKCKFYSLTDEGRQALMDFNNGV